MPISYMSVLSFVICILSVFSYLFTVNSSEPVYSVAKILFYIGSVSCLVFAILGKRHRKKNNLFGKGLEISTFIILFYLTPCFSTLIGLSDFLFLLLLFVPIIIYSRTSNIDSERNFVSTQQQNRIAVNEVTIESSVDFPPALQMSPINNAVPEIPVEMNLLSKQKSLQKRREYSAKDIQTTLDLWKQRHKSDWEIGIEYERYVGYRLECEGYKVQYVGAIQGLNDMGRDLIASKKNKTLVIQCKRWSAGKTIHEKHIFQLHGSTAVLIAENPDRIYKSVFITTAELSETARKCAEICNVTCIEQFPISDYPLIKCNSNAEGEKIYHLPFDPQYDKIIISKNKKSCYAWTIQEAEQKGFRHTHNGKTSFQRK